MVVGGKAGQIDGQMLVVVGLLTVALCWQVDKECLDLAAIRQTAANGGGGSVGGYGARLDDDDDPDDDEARATIGRAGRVTARRWRAGGADDGDDGGRAGGGRAGPTGGRRDTTGRRATDWGPGLNQARLKLTRCDNGRMMIPGVSGMSDGDDDDLPGGWSWRRRSDDDGQAWP